MGCNSVLHEEDAPVLHLRKWGASEFPYSPSSFKEGFISPARRHLLLLSYDSDGLLISLDKGQLKISDHSETAFNESISDPFGTDLMSDFISRKNISSLDEVEQMDNDGTYSGSAHAFLSDVDSVAWGLTDATESTDAPHDDASFQELLFVSGKDGVVVHTFSKSYEFRKASNSAGDSRVEHGTWVEWGPKANFFPRETHGEPEPFVKEEGSDCLYAEDMDGRRSESPKIWMKTFLAEAECLNIDGTMYTKFSKNSSFPKNSVTSFRLFESNSQFPDFLSCSGITSCDVHKPFIEPKNMSPTCAEGDTSKLRVGAVSSLSKCVKVFSDSSSQLIGFSLSTVCSTCASPSFVNNQSGCKVVVAVSRTIGLGLKWLYSAVLGSQSEWTDFAFSYSFLVCLSKYGLISLYGSMSGAYVGLVDVSNIFSLGSHPSDRPENDDDYLDDASRQLHRKRLRRLYTFPHSSLLGVMDECGVIYVLPTDDHLPDEQFLFENTFPYPSSMELGLLSGWDVGGTDIGFPRVLPTDSVLQGIKGLVLQYRRPSETDEVYEKHMVSGKALKLKREVFLPLSGFSEDDNICFSPFGITRLVKWRAYKEKPCEVVHANLQLNLNVKDEKNYRFQGWETFTSEAVGCNYYGFLYLVTKMGISVVLPSISVAQESCQVEGAICNHGILNSCAGDLTVMSKKRQLASPWKMEVLDKVFLFEGPNVAENLSLVNGWNLGATRIRHLQLALNYLEFDQIQNSLEMLMEVNLAVEGVLQLLFTTVYLMLYHVRNDSEVFSASRLLALATSYATTAIHEYGMFHLTNVALRSWDAWSYNSISQPYELVDKEHGKSGGSNNLWDMAKLLVVIRCLCRKLNDRHGKLGLILMDNIGLPNLAPVDLPEGGLENPIVAGSDLFLDGSALTGGPAVGTELQTGDKRAFVSSGTDGSECTDLLSFDHAVVLAEGNGIGERTVKVENPKDMIARWDLSYMDLNTVVKDALLSSRLPLAVLTLHLHRLHNALPDTETHDTFSDIRTVGRAIAYDLFLKGEFGLAVTTLQKLGEDVEIVLKNLVFGTLRRSLRKFIAEGMSRYVCLEPHELKILDTMALIERIYPCSSFFSALVTRNAELNRTSNAEVGKELVLHLLHPQMNINITCGDVDGVVLGPWTNLDKHGTSFEPDDDSSHSAYWTAAVAWADAWDRRVIDRILLGQPLLMGVHLLWESQLEFSMCHNDWLEVSRLLEILPPYALSRGSLHICLGDNLNTSYLEELDGVEASINVPSIKLFRIGANRMASVWLRTLMEQQLAQRLIFLTDYWPDTAEITALLAQSGFLIETHDTFPTNKGGGDTFDSVIVVNDDSSLSLEAIRALHKVVISFSSQNNLLRLLDIYLDAHQLALDQDSLSFFLDAAGDNEWVKCLLLLRVEGKEYDASFSNARAIASHNTVPGHKNTVLGDGGTIHAVDDIAEVAGEMASLATLMFAPIPPQECLSSGSVNRWYSSAQCTLENLRPALHGFPTLWKTLVTACFGQDSAGISVAIKTKVSGYSDLLEYMHWREGVFFSSTQDTSVLQMVPYWFPKGVRRLIQLYVQGPICWRMADLGTDELSMLRDIYYVINSSGHAEISALSWEAAIQKHIEEELYASSLEGAEVGLQHHLHRGRAFSAFSHLLSARVHNLKSSDESVKSEAPLTGRPNVHMDVQNILMPLSEIEVSLLSSVMPLAIEHFDDNVLVSSCVFVLGLCGVSASTLQVDVATLKRISDFYKSAASDQYRKHNSIPILDPSVETDVMISLAQALSDYYLHEGVVSVMNKAEGDTGISNTPSQTLQLVLQHLEKASLPASVSELTCGSWLMDGNGNGVLLRSDQKAASERWKLVTAFCKVHGIPPSTKYLAVLARDNDWVGFLSEAQVGRFPLEIVIQVASKEFGDPRLKTHILTVLKNMQLKRKISIPNLDTAKSSVRGEAEDQNLCVPNELFGIIAECEKQERPGEALLQKAKHLSWSILAVIASCFHDVSLLSCLTVWLEITAARETSAIKVNDIASQIAKNIGAAVEATNSLPANSRTVILRHNRKKSKRRRLVEPILLESLVPKACHPSQDYAPAELQVPVSQGKENNPNAEDTIFSMDSNTLKSSLSRMIAVLCEQNLFLPLLQAFEIFLPSCSVLPFIRGLQAFSQMRLPDATAHLGFFSIRIKEEGSLAHASWDAEVQLGVSWTISTAVKAADAMLLNCASVYEKKCLLKLLANTDFGDAGSIAMRYQQQSWKLDVGEPNLRGDGFPLLGNKTFDDASLLSALEKNGYWEQARGWAKKLETSGEPSWNFVTDHVTEMQAEAMVAEWKEFLWDVPEERIALWQHCQTLFMRFSYPALKAGQFFLKHADTAESGTPARELHKMLLLALQWLSGMITQTNMCCPLQLLRDIETRVWLLAVESESQVKSDEYAFNCPNRELGASNDSNLIDQTASIIANIDKHLSAWRMKSLENEHDNEYSRIPQAADPGFSSAPGAARTKRRAKGIGLSRKPVSDAMDKKTYSESVGTSLRDDPQIVDEFFKVDASSWKWEERVGHAELEKAVLSLLDFGQITAARQLQAKLSLESTPSEFLLIDAALKLAAASTPNIDFRISMLENSVRLVIESWNIPTNDQEIDPVKVLESLAIIPREGKGRGLCKRIVSVVRAANVLGLVFSEAFEKQPIELLRLLSLKAQESFEEAKLLVQTHPMPAASIAQILAESFLKGLLAAHRGGYIDLQKEEGPAPLLWRFSDFLKWAELCPSQSEIGHALMKLIITGQEVPHACEVELLILSHHFYKLSSCLDGVDVLVTLAATRVDAYVRDNDFSCLARLITGVGNFHALNFILGILIENGQVELLLQKYSAAANANNSTADAIRGFRMAVLTSLKQLNPTDFDSFALVYSHFDMKYDTASLLEFRGNQYSQYWFYDKYQTFDLLESLRYFTEAAEFYSSIDAGRRTRSACAQASLVSLQIRMPDMKWLHLSPTNARRVLVQQTRFPEAVIVAEAYGLNQPTEWALVLWERMLHPESTELFLDEFVAVLPLQPSMLLELARFYKLEMQARGGQSHFSVWLSGGGLPADWAKYLNRSFRSLLKRTRDFRLKLQMAIAATGFDDIITSCNKVLDKVPENAGPLILRKGHGGAYLPLM